MSWYYGKYSCGHEGRVNIVGPTIQRQGKADYIFSHRCPECQEIWEEQEWNRRKKEAAEKCREMEIAL